ncbi:MAG: PAS domain-containing protein [Methanomassiliicoccales archaeon]|nr:PAS domain-containing protein [Methanomassiliicoccales archaeon]
MITVAEFKSSANARKTIGLLRRQDLGGYSERDLPMVGSIPTVLDSIQWGAHICQFYRERDEFVDLITPFISSGLDKKHYCLWILQNRSSADEMVDVLYREVPGFDDFLRHEQVEVISQEVIDEHVDKPALSSLTTLRQYLKGKMDSCMVRNLEGMRLAITTESVEEGKIEHVMEREQLIHELLNSKKVIALCSYPSTEIEPLEITRIALDHQIIISKKDHDWTSLVIPFNQDKGSLLGELHQTFETLLSNLPGMVYRCRNDASWTMEFVSDACTILTGYAPSDLVGNAKISYAEIIHPEDRSFVWNEVQKALRERRSFTIEYRIITRHGEEKWVWEQGQGLYDDSGNVIAIEGFIIDVTSKKRAEESIMQLNDILKVINRTMRHDLLNELTVIGGSLELFVEMKNEKFLKNALTAVKKSTELIKRMKELEQFAFSGIGLKPIRIREVLEKVIGSYPIKFNIDGDCSVMADEALMSVFDNIIRNAVVHGKTDRIDIVIKSDTNTCEIKIIDFGVGIPESIRNRILEEGVSYGNGRGSGLGLYLAKKTIDRYHGCIHVEENKPQGAIFVINLKRA